VTVLERLFERMAKLAPPRHRELVRGMSAELDSITDPAERTRFALGAIAAIARLSLSGYARAAIQLVGLGDPEDDAHHGGPSMSKVTPRQLLRRHVVPFAVSFVSLTALLLAQRWARELSELELTHGTIVQVLVLGAPSTVALTIPMAIFLAVSWVFTRLGAEGVLASARRERRGVRRLLAPVLGGALVFAAMAFVWNTVVLPRANARLVEVLNGAPRELTERTMTIGELRAAAEDARTDAQARLPAAVYEVEIQKKYAIAAGCVVLALAAAAIAIRFPGYGAKLVLAAGSLVFIGYYLMMVAGEALADEQLLSPIVAMWMANAVLLVFALVIVRPRDLTGPTDGVESLAIDG
jgi:lipopolysaccharide export LptBFGC system permease protein LptF